MHRGGGTPESLRRSLCDRLERRRAGERLTERGGDPVEAALDSCLPRALRKRLGVTYCERGEAGERLEHPGVAGPEAAAAAPPDSEHAAHLSAPRHRRSRHVGETLVRRVRDGALDRAVRALDERPPLADRRAGQPLVHRELEAEQRFVEAVHGDAAERPALAVEDVAVGCVGVEQIGELVGEPLEDDGKVELAAERVGGTEQRRLLGEPLLVLRERLLERDTRPQPLERDGRLRRERLHEREVICREDAALVGGRDGDDRDHALLERSGTNAALLRAGRLDELATDEVRFRRVVDGERGGFEDGARDPGRLVREVESQFPPPVDVLAARAREIADRLAPVIGDERQARERDAGHRRDLVEERARDALDVGGPREFARDAADALELSAAAGCPAVRANPLEHSLGAAESTVSGRFVLRRIRFTKMGRTAHCPRRKRPVACFSLGDANRGASSTFSRLAPGRARCDRPPEQRAFPAMSRTAANAPRLSLPAVVKRLLLASPRGYCAGVERAVETVERALALYGSPVYVRKQIVHNSHVVRDLEARGAVFVDELSSVPEGSNVVFSAHGIAPAVRVEAGERGLATIDATCPLVTKVHAQARRYASAGYAIVLIGHAGHEEVEGTLGEAPEAIVLVQSTRGCGARVAPGRPAARVHHADDALGRRDERDRRGAPPPLPAHRGAGARRHLLRDLQPPVGREGAARGGRPAARRRLAELLELGAPRRRRARRRRRCAPRRRHRRRSTRAGSRDARRSG